jgi:hypothetical protein
VVIGLMDDLEQMLNDPDAGVQRAAAAAIVNIWSRKVAGPTSQPG